MMSTDVIPPTEWADLDVLLAAVEAAAPTPSAFRAVVRQFVAHECATIARDLARVAVRLDQVRKWTARLNALPAGMAETQSSEPEGCT